MKNNRIRFITEMSIFIALGLALDYLAGIYSGFIWPAGGSISIAMLPIFMMSFRYGLKGGLLSGVAIGVLQLLWAGGEQYHWASFILDYLFPYGIVGIAGLFAKRISNSQNNSDKIIFANIAMLLGGIIRSISHIISGYVAFKVPWGASAIYNLGYMIPSLILCMIIMNIIILKYDHLVEYIEL